MSWVDDIWNLIDSSKISFVDCGAQFKGRTDEGNEWTFTVSPIVLSAKETGLSLTLSEEDAGIMSITLSTEEELDKLIQALVNSKKKLFG